MLCMRLKALEDGEKTKQEIEKVASELDKFVEPSHRKDE